MKFEEALDKLERIIRELEDGELPLEEGLKKYEEGVKLASFCQEKLEGAEKKISILRSAPGGPAREVPFNDPSDPPEDHPEE